MTKIVSLDDVSDDTADADLAAFRGGAVSIGNFDGVHLGHQSLLGQLRTMADDLGGPAVAVTFDPHPAAVLRPGAGPTPLSRMTTRGERMRSAGVDALVVCHTTPRLLALTAEEFYRSLLDDRLAARGVVEGPNFYFGRDRRGNVELLRQWCRRDDRQFSIAEATDDDGRMVSSSRIRDRILAGDVERASEMMGRPHRIIAPVVSGESRGRTIGFPTANLWPIDVVIPADGVYAGRVEIAGGHHAAAIHIGPNLTFDDGRRKFEVHVLDFDGDLYGRTLAVDVCYRVRDIFKFASADDLKRQLGRDIDLVRRHFSASQRHGPS